ARSTTQALPVGSGAFLSNGAVYGVPIQRPRTAAFDGHGAVEALRNLAATLPAPRATQVLPGPAPCVDLLALHQPLPVRILLLGAGDDAQPVAQYSHALGWRVTVIDHR